MSRMKAVREEIGCSQTKMAKLIGTWPNRICEIESENCPRKETKQMQAQLTAIKLINKLCKIEDLEKLIEEEV